MDMIPPWLPTNQHCGLCYLRTGPGCLLWWAGVLCLRLFCVNFFCLGLIVFSKYSDVFFFSLWKNIPQTILKNPAVYHWYTSSLASDHLASSGTRLDASWRFKNYERADSQTSLKFESYCCLAFNLAWLTCVAAFVIAMLLPQSKSSFSGGIFSSTHALVEFKSRHTPTHPPTHRLSHHIKTTNIHKTDD